MAQTGIQVSSELQSAFASAIADSTRLLRATIVDEGVTLSETYPVNGTWKEDFQLVTQAGEHGISYLFYYIEPENEQTNNNNSWVLITYIPDGSKVKDRMLYAATKATILRQLGSSHFAYNIHATSMDDLSLEGFSHYMDHNKADAPLTEAEQSLQELKKQEGPSSHGTTSRVTHVKGMDVNVTEDTLSAVKEYLASSTNLVMLILIISTVRNTDREELMDIDGKTETVQAIHLDDSKHIKLDQLIYFFPTDTPRFTLYKYASDLTEAPIDVFIYSCPTGSHLRDRMLYSAMRGVVLMKLQSLGFDTKNRIEVDDPYDLTEEYLNDRLNLQPAQPQESEERELLGQSTISFRPAPPGQSSRRPKTRRPPQQDS